MQVTVLRGSNGLLGFEFKKTIELAEPYKITSMTSQVDYNFVYRYNRQMGVKGLSFG